MRLVPDRKRPFNDQRLEAQIEDIETEGDRQLKELLDKQLKKDVSLHEHLARKKTFTQPTLEKTVVEETKGTLTLQKYKYVEDRVDHINELRQLGLTDDEVEFKLRSEGLDAEGKPLTKRSKFGENPSVYESRMKEIDAKIAAKMEQLEQPDKFSGAKVMSRHEMDLEKAISHDQQKTKSLSILLTDAKSEDKTLQSEDPINHIKELLGKVERAESKFFKPQSQGSGESSESDAESEDSQAPTCFTYKEFLKKTKQELQDRPVVDVPPSECPDCKRSTEQCYYHSKQKGDQKDQALPDQERNIRESIPKLNVPGDGVKKNRKQRKKDRIISGMKHQTSAGVSSERVESIPVDVIKQYRISVDDIKQMERFADYSPGEPSKTLYLKNLSGKVTERDLRSIFQRYETSQDFALHCRLLSGRMKGQAFVSFPDVETAAAALHLVNGYQFKGKPIIIQYGRKE